MISLYMIGYFNQKMNESKDEIAFKEKDFKLLFEFENDDNKTKKEKKEEEDTKCEKKHETESHCNPEHHKSNSGKFIR